ncbi:MAG: MotA/TolQ/ExbB proton channel family protein [Planctomycetota bacterium]
MDQIIELLREARKNAAPDSESLLESGLYIWDSGGWAMIVLAVIALFIFAIGFHVLHRLRQKRFGRIDEATWRRWIHEPADRKGPMGELFDSISRVTDNERVAINEAFDEVRTAEVEPFERDLRLMKIAVGAAPLVGLLGTVTGMLSTFNAMASGGGGDKTMTMIAKGISEALYTTETGLVVALPGLFFHYFLSRRYERYRAFLAHVESVWAQKAHEDHEIHLRETIEEIAREELKKRVERRLIAGQLEV